MILPFAGEEKVLQAQTDSVKAQADSVEKSLRAQADSVKAQAKSVKTQAWGAYLGTYVLCGIALVMVYQVRCGRWWKNDNHRTTRQKSHETST